MRSPPKFNGGNANAAAGASERKHASGVTYIPYQHLTGVGTPEETPRGPLSTSETDGARSYKYQPAGVSRACIGDSRVTDTRSLPSRPPSSQAAPPSWPSRFTFLARCRSSPKRRPGSLNASCLLYERICIADRDARGITRRGKHGRKITRRRRRGRGRGRGKRDQGRRKEVERAETRGLLNDPRPVRQSARARARKILSSG